MHNELYKLLAGEGFQLAGQHEYYLIFNFPPEEDGEGANQVINLILSINGGSRKVRTALHLAKYPTNVILIEGDNIFVVLPPPLQHNKILVRRAFVAGKNIVDQLPNLLKLSFLAQQETIWLACECGRRFPQGALGAMPYPIFNPKVNRTIKVECDACAQNAVGLRFG